MTKESMKHVSDPMSNFEQGWFASPHEVYDIVCVGSFEIFLEMSIIYKKRKQNTYKIDSMNRKSGAILSTDRQWDWIDSKIVLTASGLYEISFAMQVNLDGDVSYVCRAQDGCDMIRGRSWEKATILAE